MFGNNDVESWTAQVCLMKSFWMHGKPKILFLTGGPDFHPVAKQVAFMQPWLSDAFQVEDVGVNAFFGGLEEADLAVVGGLHWTGAGDSYVSPDESQRAQWRAYVSSGRPVCGFHGGIASFDDWPEFGQLLGFQWIWGYTAHSRVDAWPVTPVLSDHPVVRGLERFTVEDELYFNVCVQPGMELQVHARADYHGVDFPMLMTGRGGRCDGAGKTAYIANGHDLRALEAPMLRHIITRTFEWLLEQETPVLHSINS